MTHLFDEVTREIARMERSCDQHLGLKAEPFSGPPKTSIRHLRHVHLRCASESHYQDLP